MNLASINNTNINIYYFSAFSASTLLVGRQERQPIKN